MKRIQVKQLVPGDVMTGTGETVISTAIGYLTPKGNVEIILQKGDKKRHVLWGKYTMVGVDSKQCE